MTEFIGIVDIKRTTGSGPSIKLDGSGGLDDGVILYRSDGKARMKMGSYYDFAIVGESPPPIDTFSIMNPEGEKIVNLSSEGSLELGGSGTNGGISLVYKDGVDSTSLGEGNMMLFDEAGHRGFALLSRAPSLSGIKPTTGMWIGASPREGPKAGIVFIRDSDGNDSIKLDGASGDIILANADCAEDFDIIESAEIDPGTVMVIEQKGKLQQSNIAYDKRVVGVVSGALNYKPGLVLDKRQATPFRKSISLMGKVYCKADAQYGSIDVGDLLTTSNTPGHAMKATDPMKAFGSVIGKALGSLNKELGLIPILVTLQ